VKKVETFYAITDIYIDLTKTVVGDVSNAIRNNFKDGQIIHESEKEHNHTPDIAEIEVRKAIQFLKTTAKHTELSTQAVLGAVSLQVNII